MRWTINHCLHLIGRRGIVGIGLVLFSIGLYASLILPENQELARIQTKFARMQQMTVRSPTSFEGSRESLADYYEFFPPMETKAKWLDKVYQIASEQALELPQVEYHVVENTSSRVGEYQLIFSLKGTYLQLRKFVAALLNNIPFLSLDDIRFDKRKISDPVMDANLKLTLFLRTR